jgi:formylmethanofuran dehydrogenase subunit E
MEEVVAIVETNTCFSDSVQLVTGCSFGNNGLIYRDYGKTAVTLAMRTGDAVRVAQKANRSPLENFPEVAPLFQKVIKERSGTVEDDEKLRRLWVDISFKMLEIPDEEFFNISRLNIQVPAYAPIFASVTCSLCGENTMEPRARMKDGKPVCLSCSDQDYYQLAGDGISIVRYG